MNMVIDFRKPDLRKAKVGTVVITSKGFKFKLMSRQKKKEAWLDLTSKVIWYDAEDEKYAHNQAVKKFGNALPTREEFEKAEKHGFREVLPNMAGLYFWSASLSPNNTDFAWGFSGSYGYSYFVNRSDNFDSVRCVGR